MKTIQWRNGNHMLIDTGHKTFDQQCECLSTGNVWGTVQFSNYIRPYTETECNGRENPLGHLRTFDLDMFKALPLHVRKQVEELTKTEQGILYEIRHWKRPLHLRQKIVHGYILTRSDHTLVHVWNMCWRHKSFRIMEEAVAYLSNKALNDKSRDK